MTDDLTPAIRAAVLAALPDPDAAQQPELQAFHRHMREYPNRAGKTLRGQVLMYSSRAHGGDDPFALTAAAALELFQNWVLIHDDIEDGSEERRGKPALHRSIGVPVALNVGDAMHVYMWKLLLALPTVSTGGDRAAILREFEWMILRTAEGQHIDLSWVQDGRFDIDEADYLAMVTRKTAYYTVVSPLRLGAACATVEPHPDLDAAGVDLGVAFQIRDDVLNLMPEVSYGKEFAGDLYEGKRTLVLAHLFAHVDSNERSELESLLSQPRARKRPPQIERVLHMIRQHGSLAYAQEVAEMRARRGLEVLEVVLADLPERPAADALLETLRSIAHRRS